MKHNDCTNDDPFALDLEDGNSELVNRQSREITQATALNDGRLDVSDVAKAKISAMLANRSSGSFFRVQVKGGGCSGYQVSFVIEQNLKSGDILLEEDGVRVVIDVVALSLVAHAIVDYQENFSGSFFHLVVPKSVAQCGCGESFAL